MKIAQFSYQKQKGLRKAFQLPADLMSAKSDCLWQKSHRKPCSIRKVNHGQNALFVWK
ncbi:MAG: hypothetical protein HY401_10460 [Elusimicrobia bacterium]|nr:hypothetical protein [Elusimicrobiota bacterium]